ncbi:PspC domain-containing protein [Lutibacter sp.]
MNKTININLGGIFFHIDELAYLKLKRYLDAIKLSLGDDSQGRDEILHDIELRIGELLSERIANERQVINEADIDEITKIMGKPEDYMVDEEIFEDQPKHKTASKKLFRDGDDKFLGGVCSGLAHYFGIETIWMRIIWLILLFGFGIGFLIYPLLWILIPQAETTAEKLQMKGEPVNINNIERKIKEELDDITSRVKDGVNKVKDSDFKKNVEHKAKSGIQDLTETLGNIFLAIFKVLGKLIGALLIFIASATLLGLFFGLLSWGSFEIIGVSNEYVNYPPFLFDSIIPTWLLIVFIFLAIGIPFIILFMLGVKILSNNVKSFSSTTKLSLLGVWIISLLGLGFSLINFTTQTAFDGVYKYREELPIVANDTLTIKMVDSEDLSTRKELKKRYSSEIVYVGDTQKVYATKISVDIKPTDKLNAFVKIRKESEGKSIKHANKSAETIEYQFNLNNQNLLLNGYFLSEIKNQFKNQYVDITIYLPVNAIIYLDKSTRTYLYDIENTQGIFDRDMPKHYYKMTSDGLECLDCNPNIFNIRKKNNYFKLNIDSSGVEIKVKDGTSNAKVKIDENGVIIR